MIQAVKNFFGTVFSFVRSALSEPDGTGSSTRICMVALIGFVIGTGVTYLCKMHTVVTPTDVCNVLSSLGVFTATTCAPLYAINKGAEAWKHTSQTNADAVVNVADANKNNR